MNTPSPSTASTGSPQAASAKPGPLSGSLASHRRQSVWQIWVPLGFGVAIILALAALSVVAATRVDPTPLVRWTNISLIFLIIPLAMAALVFVLLFAGLIFLMARILHLLPHYTQLGQTYAHSFSVLVRGWCDRAAGPFLAVRSSWAGVQTLRRRLIKH